MIYILFDKQYSSILTLNSLIKNIEIESQILGILNRSSPQEYI